MQETRDVCLIPGSGRSPREGNGNPLQNSCLNNPMDRGGWQAIAQRVSESLKDLDTAQRSTALKAGGLISSAP